MDDFLRDFIIRKHRVKTFTFTFLDVLLTVCISVTGILLRSTVVSAYTPADAGKIAGTVCEYLLAVICSAVVCRYTGSRLRTIVTYSAVVIWPTVAANGSLLNAGCVYYALLIFMGLYLFISGYRKLGVTGTFLGLFAAAAKCVSWYLAEGAAAQSLTRGWPNVFVVIGDTVFVEYYKYVSILFLAGLLLSGAYCFVKKKIRITEGFALDIVLFLAVLIPYFAPFMPAWAGYTADVALLVYGMKRFDRFYLPVLHCLVSYAAYALYTNGESKLPMALYAVILLFILVNVGIDLYRDACTAPMEIQDASRDAEAAAPPHR